jgi:hypothetical protein
VYPDFNTRYSPQRPKKTPHRYHHFIKRVVGADLLGTECLCTIGWSLLAKETEVLLGGLCEERLWLCPVERSVSWSSRKTNVFIRSEDGLNGNGNVLSEVLVLVSAELGCAGAHDGVGWRNVFLVSPERSVSIVFGIRTRYGLARWILTVPRRACSAKPGDGNPCS